jgi:hypothetical protein
MVPSACRASSSSQGGGLFEADPAQATGRRIAATTSKEEARAGEDAAPPSSVCGPLPFLAMVEAAAAPHWPAEAVLPSISQPTSSAWLLRGTRSRSSSRGMAAASRCRRPGPSNRCSLLPQNPKARRSSWGGRDRLQILGHKYHHIETAAANTSGPLPASALKRICLSAHRIGSREISSRCFRSSGCSHSSCWRVAASSASSRAALALSVAPWAR